MSSITILEYGDFLQIYIDQDIIATNNYFKNAILKTDHQLNLELANFFYNFESLGGRSIDPIYHSEELKNAE
ncbi:hypothetical protein ACFSX9_09715 [Flavobacterium ardleyense]|uniref:Uncharacterized protein n=1 Tax=Flavobacterium ardleyense TaxID=2038737 RepID=A0ABW5Z811_9FLAO